MKESSIELFEILSKLQTGISRIEFEVIKNKKIDSFNTGAYIEALISSNILNKNKEIYFLYSGTNLMVDIMDLKNKKSNLISYKPDKFFIEEMEDLLEY